MKFDPFGSIPVTKQGRTNFDESHSVSGTFPLSQMIPVFCTDTIPGDQWRINIFNLTKLETLISPAMQQIDASLLWFKIPKRLLFKHFKDWYSGGTDGQDNSQKPHIYLRHFLWEVLTQVESSTILFDLWLESAMGPGSLWQYLGLPVPLKYDNGVWKIRSISEILDFDEVDRVWVEPEKVDSDYIDIMPFMAYWMLYDQYFRDQTLCDPMFENSEDGILKINRDSWSWELNTGDPSDDLEFPASSGTDLSEGGEVSFEDFAPLMVTFKRAWKKDYFTSALPTPQRGPEVKLNFTDQTAPVNVKNGYASFEVGADQLDQGIIDAGEPIALTRDLTPGDQNSSTLGAVDGLGVDHALHFTKIDNLQADLSNLSPITITAFRNLFKLQAFLEKNNVAGGRFIETILAQWGERVPDFTVQRAQYIRATSIPVQISEVVATANSSTGVNRTVGDQGGIARTQGNLGYVNIYTHEPSFIFGLYCVTCPPSYVGQGIPKMYQRITRFDEPWRDFQHIGEQAIKVRELYYPFQWSLKAKSDEDFGYQQRFSEFKYMPSRVVGDFATSLSYWHMARMFDQVPLLNQDFVTQNLDERIFAVPNLRPVIADFFFSAVAKRKLSKFSTPKLT